MTIRFKLASALIGLMVLAIMVTISFSILWIRDHLYEIEKAELKARVTQAAQLLPTLPEAAWAPLLQTAVRKDRIAWLTDASGATKAGTQPTLPTEVTERLAASDERLELDTEEILLTRQRVFVSQTKYYLNMATPRSVIHAELLPIRWFIYHGMFISVGLVVLLAVAFAYRVTRPVLQLKQAAEKIAGGSYETLTQLSTRKDELGLLAHALNRMAGSLQRDNESLRTLNAQLQELNARQRRFYADMAHELKNPLHTLLAALEMLERDDIKPTDRARYLTMCSTHAQRLNQMFADLLLLDRADADPNFLQRTNFDMGSLVELVTNAYEPIENGKLAINLQMGMGDMRVLADKARIQQVLENLITNAIKYTNDGSVDVSISATGGQVHVCVTDTGIGIAPEHLPHLTERFYRTDDARGRDSGGTGLGLAVVQSILEAHGSKLHITSEAGKGSSFAFALPQVPI